MPKQFSEDEVSKHNNAHNCWVIIGARGSKKVYDVTAFLEDHPGGPDVLLDLAGQDVQDEFEACADIGHSKEAREMLEQLYIGNLIENAVSQAQQEALKQKRITLLMHPEMTQKHTSQWLSLGKKLLLGAIAFGILAIVLEMIQF